MLLMSRKETVNLRTILSKKFAKLKANYSRNVGSKMMIMMMKAAVTKMTKAVLVMIIVVVAVMVAVTIKVEIVIEVATVLIVVQEATIN